MKKKILVRRDPDITASLVESTGLSHFQEIPKIKVSDLSHRSREAPAPLVPDPRNVDQKKK